MVPLREWPAPLLRRWLVSAGIGFLCLFVGIVMFVTAKDKMMLLISTALSLVVAMRSILFYKLVCAQQYEVVEGVCIAVRRALLRKQRTIHLMNEDGAEHVIMLDKRLPVRIGRCYRAYYRTGSFPEGSQLFQSYLAQDQFLALEDIGEYREQTAETEK